jgi:hypothetical protein
VTGPYLDGVGRRQGPNLAVAPVPAVVWFLRRGLEEEADEAKAVEVGNGERRRAVGVEFGF